MREHHADFKFTVRGGFRFRQKFYDNEEGHAAETVAKSALQNDFRTLLVHLQQPSTTPWLREGNVAYADAYDSIAFLDVDPAWVYLRNGIDPGVARQFLGPIRV